jgi:hypothetical protein
MIFIGHYLVDSGSSWFNNLYNSYQVTIPKTKITELKKFIEEKVVASISEEKDWVYDESSGKVSFIIGWPGTFEDITELYSFLKNIISSI